MRRFGSVAIVLGLVLATSACGSGKKIGENGGLGASTVPSTNLESDSARRLRPEQPRSA